MAQFYSLGSTDSHAIYMEFRMIEMTIRGEIGYSVGNLRGIAQLMEFPGGYSSDPPPSVPIGSHLAMSGTVTLQNGAVFDPTMWSTAKTMQIEGFVDMSRVVPEPSSLVGCLLLVFVFTGMSCRRHFPSRIG
jgi:hypothetical protein